MLADPRGALYRRAVQAGDGKDTDRAGARKGLKWERGADVDSLALASSKSAAVPATVSGEQDISLPSSLAEAGHWARRCIGEVREGRISRCDPQARRPASAPVALCLGPGDGHGTVSLRLSDELCGRGRIGVRLRVRWRLPVGARRPSFG